MAALSEAPLAITMGEPAGIGTEIVLKAWLQRQSSDAGPFFLIADPEDVNRTARQLGLPVIVKEITEPAAARTLFAQELPVLRVALPTPVAAGTPHTENNSAVIAAIEQAVGFAQSGQASAVVTNPIHKETLARSGFAFSGHTDFLGHLTNARRTVMMLVSERLKVVPLTVHVGLRQAIDSLTTDLLIDSVAIIDQRLRADFGLTSPRIAVSGLNPHAGEGGLFGFEEGLVISPAISALRDRGVDVHGPHPADSLFHPHARNSYDVAVCMYHDQALIPIKTLDFANAVNVTLGLPIIRTSPDHGTALDIAGRGVADPTSMIEALRVARRIVSHRNGQS